MANRRREIFKRACTTLAGLALAVGVAAAQTQVVSQSSTPGTPTVKTLKLSGTVLSVEGNQLFVRMNTGEVRVFTPPPDRRFVIDGKELTLGQLQPGTKLNATVTETATPVTNRTVESLEGKVWYAKNIQVILTLANGENKMYIVKHDDPVKLYDSSGKEITTFDLRKGMNIRATKITESPSTEFASNTAVTGVAPTPAQTAAAVAIAQGTAPAQGTAAQGTAPVGSQAAGGTGSPELPKTASPLPLVGLLGLLFTGVGLGIRRYRRV